MPLRSSSSLSATPLTIVSGVTIHQLLQFLGQLLLILPLMALLTLLSRPLLSMRNTQRLAQMGSDYYSLVQPWYHAPVIPLETGYHMYSYSLDFICLDPMGSTNYGKLTNVSLNPEASAGAIVGANGSSTDPNSGVDFSQTYEFVTTVVNNNIIRISGGALGFPVL